MSHLLLPQIFCKQSLEYQHRYICRLLEVLMHKHTVLAKLYASMVQVSYDASLFAVIYARIYAVCSEASQRSLLQEASTQIHRTTTLASAHSQHEKKEQDTLESWLDSVLDSI